MRVGRIIRRSLLARWHRIAKQNGEDIIIRRVGLGFIESYFSWSDQDWRELEGNALRATRVLERKFWLERRGSRKDLAHVPAVVTEVSCPSFAKMF